MDEADTQQTKEWGLHTWGDIELVDHPRKGGPCLKKKAKKSYLLNSIIWEMLTGGIENRIPTSQNKIGRDP